MPAYTTVLGLYKPGGGSTGQIPVDEPVDIDKLNSNFDRIDGAVGLGYWSTSTRPIAPYVGQIGLNTTSDVYERWNGVAWVNALPNYLKSAALGSAYFTQSQLTGGALDNRYFTQTNLLTGKVLDGTYPSKTISGSAPLSMLQFRMAGGSDLVTNFTFDSGTGRWSGTKTVFFPTGRFDDCPGPPGIFGTATSGDPFGAIVTEMPSVTTKSQATFQISRRNNVDTGFQWFAYRSINS